MRRKGVLMTLLFLWIYLVGMGILLYPAINNYYTGKRMESSVESFYSTDPTEDGTDNSFLTIPTAETEPPTPFPELLEMLKTYNRGLYENDQVNLNSLEATEEAGVIFSVIGQHGDVFGVITIPRISLEMPVYLGATDKHMADGAAQLGQTSIPIGGKNTNAVIAGHRGYNGAPYFRYVPELQIGDSVNITNLWGTLHYKVVETRIIQPNDIDAIKIQPGRDLITLLTCHPYASGGRQRFLVICERMEEENGR